MQKTDILNEVNKIFSDVLDNDNLTITESTAASDIDEWDSLTHIQLVVAIEKCFKLKFTSAEIRDWKNVGEMVENIQQKIG
jgi:acyl carrier protein